MSTQEALKQALNALEVIVQMTKTDVDKKFLALFAEEEIKRIKASIE